jgi:hypothetical protein
MKIRNGFVSNSSSSSFVVSLKDITAAQYVAIMENDYKDQPWPEPWDIVVTSTDIEGSTFMDNYSMFDFFEKIGVDTSKVKWEGENF